MTKVTRVDVGLLLLRLGMAALLIFGHGLMKWKVVSGASSSFPDPLGIGAYPAALCAMGAEVGCAAAVGIGLLTRLAALPLLFTMTVIAGLAHPGEPWLNKEPSVLYFVVYLALLIVGPGALSVDAWWAGRRRRAAAA